MDIPLDEVIHFDSISSGSTGVAVDADSTPTFAIYEEATDTDIGVGGNMTKRTSLTGNYRGSFTASAANGFEVGKWYNVIGSATIGGVACKGVLKSFRIVAAESIAGYPKTDQHALKGDAQSSTDAKDFFDAGYDPTAHKVQGVVLVDTLTTYTGNTPQTGDSFALIGATGSGLTSLASQASVNTIDDFLDTEIAAILAAVDTEVAAILADTNELQTDWADGGRLDLILDARASQASLDTLDDFVDTEVAAIKAKTDALPPDPADASDIAASFATVNTKLDTIDDLLDTEIPALTTAVADLPTNAELATALAAADDAVLAAIAALNDLSSADAQSAAAAALAAYDPPTNAEMEARTIAAANYATAAELTNKPTLAQILAGGDVDGFTVEQTLKLVLAALTGELSGAATTTIEIRAADDSKVRITATVDASGNRTALTLDAAG